MKIEGQNPAKFFLKGAINENSELNEIFSKISGPTVFDLSGVEKINSIGIHRWVPLIKASSEKYSIEIERLSYSLAIQAGSILNLFGKAKINSILAPYFCAKCERDYLVELSTQAICATKNEIPLASCKSCTSEMTFDELPQYFEFIRQ